MKNRISLLLILLAISFSIHAQKVMRIGIIGLDTSHSTAFTELINSGSDETFSKGFRVVAAYPYGSKTIQSSYERIPGYIEKVKANGVEITSSIADLLEKVDCVLLETNDGRLHLEQAVEVFKSGKICYIDKPIGATLGDAIAIYEMAEKYKCCKSPYFFKHIIVQFIIFCLYTNLSFAIVYVNISIYNLNYHTNCSHSYGSLSHKKNN